MTVKNILIVDNHADTHKLVRITPELGDCEIHEAVGGEADLLGSSAIVVQRLRRHAECACARACA